MTPEKYNADIHHRHSIRLKGYDYSQEGSYFVTICTQNRECLFGNVVNGKVRMNDPGEMIVRTWEDLPQKYSGVEIDQFIVMPNHIHAIIVLPVESVSVGAGPCACPSSVVTFHGPHAINAERWQPHTKKGHRHSREGHPQGGAPTRISLSDIVHRFKSFTTAQYRTNVRQHKWPPFNSKLWQRNYYEHIIRNEDELNRIRKYIVNNPAQWAEDKENPRGRFLLLPVFRLK